MMQLNTIGLELAEIEGVKAMTDVTGFSLLGHLSEMCEGSNLSAILDYNKIPKISVLQEYIDQKSMPGGTFRNWDAYGHQIGLADEKYKPILCDPQTSGGLLIAVEDDSKEEVEAILKKHNILAQAFGYLKTREKLLITVK